MRLGLVAKAAGGEGVQAGPQGARRRNSQQGEEQTGTAGGRPGKESAKGAIGCVGADGAGRLRGQQRKTEKWPDLAGPRLLWP